MKKRIWTNPTTKQIAFYSPRSTAVLLSIV